MSHAPRGDSWFRSLLPIVLAALAAFVLVAGIAYAARRFDPSHRTIVIHRSIAGVRLGQSVSAAKRAWKGDVSCSPQGDAAACLWRGGGERLGQMGFIYARGVDKVDGVSINAGTSALHQTIFRKPLTTLKTSRGIGLGSRSSAVRKAYPGGTRPGPFQYSVTRGKAATMFVFTEKRRVSAITIENHGGR